jgi:hypothetical protein
MNNFGIKISKPGVDVTLAATKDLVVDTTQTSALKIAKIVTFSGFADSYPGQYQILTPHGMGYIPLYTAMFTTLYTGDPIPFYSPINFSVLGLGLLSVSIDKTNIIMYVVSGGPLDIPDANYYGGYPSSITVSVTIFAEKII